MLRSSPPRRWVPVHQPLGAARRGCCPDRRPRILFELAIGEAARLMGHVVHPRVLCPQAHAVAEVMIYHRVGRMHGEVTVRTPAISALALVKGSILRLIQRAGDVYQSTCKSEGPSTDGYAGC